VVVQPHQRGMILRFGRVVNEDAGPGLHFKLPWPIDRLTVPVYTATDPVTKEVTTSYTATGVRTIDAGTNPPTGGKDEPILWTTEHTAEEVFTIVQPASTSAGSRPGQAAQDEPPAETDLAMVAVEVPVQYAIRDVEAYELLAAPEQRDTLLKATAQRAAMQYISTLTVDEVLDKSRATMGAELRRRVEQAFIDLNPKRNGQPVVEVLFVGTAGAHPPKDVAPRFEQVIEAQQKYLSRLDDAHAEATKTLIGVVGNEALAWDIGDQLRVRDGMRARVQGATDPAEQERLRAELTEQELKVERLLEKAGGSAASEVLEARSDRWSASLGAKADATAYLGKVQLDLAASKIYRAEQYFQALREIIAGARIYITSDRVRLHLRLDLMDKSSANDSILNIGNQGGNQQ
jgi:regulator of protease activity HflC (stomatin/prohibitin superfamily)